MRTSRRSAAPWPRLLSPARGFAVAVLIAAPPAIHESAAQAPGSVEITLEGMLVMSLTAPIVYEARSSLRNVLFVSPRGDVTFQNFTNGWFDASSSTTTRFGSVGRMQNDVGRASGVLRIQPGNRIDNRFRVTTNAGSVVDVRRLIVIRRDTCVATMDYRIRSKGGLAHARAENGVTATFNGFRVDDLTCRIRSL